MVTVTVVAVVVVVMVLILMRMLVLLLLMLPLPLLLIARLRLHEAHDVARTAGLDLGLELGLDVGCVRFWVICSSGQIRSDQIESGPSFVRPQWCPWGASFFFLCVYLLLPFPSRSIVSVTFLDLGFAGTGAS